MNFPKSVICGGLAAVLAACAAPAPKLTVTGDYLAGRLAAGVNDIGAAAAAYGDAVVSAPTQADLVRDAFFFHVAAGEVEAAALFARQLIAGDKPDELARLTLAAIAVKKGDLEAARAQLEAPFAEPFAKTIAFLESAWVEAGMNGPTAAIEALDAGGSDIFQGFVPVFKALLEEMAGDTDAARQAHELSIYSFGGPVGREAYGAFLERIGDKAAAREFYALLDREPGPSRRVAQAGLDRLERGRVSAAYTNVSAAEGTAIAMYLFAGNLLEQSAGQRQRASEAGFNVGQPRYNFPLVLAQIAIYLDPDFADARRLVSGILNAYGNYDAARLALEPIDAKSPHFEQARIEIAGGLAAQARTDKALAILKRAIRRDPGANEARLSYAGLLAREGRHEDAIDVINVAVDRLNDPQEDAWRFFVARAAALMELDRWPQAEADLKRAVEIAPEEPTALNYLGYSWAERGENLEEAFRLIEKAAALQPGSGAIIDSLGWAHYQLGAYKEAVGHLEQAAALEPADPTITDHLGDVYWRLGREREARYQWRRALELNPDDRIRSILEFKLEDGLSPVGKQAAPAPVDAL